MSMKAGTATNRKQEQPMIVTDVKTWAVANPPPHFGGPFWVFVKLTTDNGIVCNG